MGALPQGEPWPENNLLVSQDGKPRSFHAYVHIPFCEVRCGYCDFNTYTQDELPGVTKASFHQSLVREVLFSAEVLERSGLPKRELKSVFFGGGTPSLFATEQIAVVLDELSQQFGLSADCEVTMEANPESLDLASLNQLRRAGVNRLSVGVQGFDPEVLAVLDRRHDPAKVAPLIKASKDSGFRVSLDLIYGTPGESMATWAEAVDRAIELETGHISAYSLIVEPGTKLNRLIRSGKLAPVDEDLNAEKYELMTEAFESAGLGWYEISNFGDPSVHNLAYWNSQDWWGYGPGAHSHIAGNRFWNKKHPSAYQSGLEQGTSVQAMERLTPRQRLEEELMLGLRTKEGVRRELFSELAVDAGEVARQLAEGLISMDRERVFLTRSGRLLADRLVVDFLN